MEFKDRLRIAMDAKNVSANAIGEETKVSKTSVLQYLKGTMPGLKNIAILANYLGVSAKWLIDGEGEAPELIKHQKNEQPKEKNISTCTPHCETKKLRAIPHIEEHAASCGIPNGFSVAIKREDCESYIIPDMPNCDFTMRTRGRSMVNRNCPERNINERDIVACKIWTSRTHLRWGEVYALATNDGIVVKQIQESEKDGYVKCVPFNDEEGFKPYDLPVEEITDWAIVVGVISVKTWN